MENQIIQEEKPINHKYDIRKVYKINLKEYSFFEFFNIKELNDFVRKEIKHKSNTLIYYLEHSKENQENIKRLTKEIKDLNEVLKNG